MEVRIKNDSRTWSWRRSAWGHHRSMRTEASQFDEDRGITDRWGQRHHRSMRTETSQIDDTIIPFHPVQPVVQIIDSIEFWCKFSQISIWYTVFSLKFDGDPEKITFKLIRHLFVYALALLTASPTTFLKWSFHWTLTKICSKINYIYPI
jgi:hypothetical protein